MNRKALILVILANVVYGCSFMMTTLAIQSSGQALFGLLATRFTVAFLVLGLLALCRVLKVNYRGKPVHKLLGIALIYPGLYFFSETMSLTQVSSAIVGVVIGIAPITTVIMSALILHTRQRASQIAFMVLSILGVVVINLGGEGGAPITLKSLVFLVLALLSFSFYSIAIHRVGKEFTSPEITLFMMFAGAVIFNLLDCTQRGPFAYGPDLAHLNYLLPVLFLGVLSSGASGLALNYGFSKLPPVTVSVINNVTSLVAVLCGVVFLREKITLQSFLGCAMILAGCVGYSLIPSDTGQGKA